MSIEQTQAELVAEFDGMTDWKERYRLIIGMGKELAEFPAEHRVEGNIVKGCQNTVYLHAEMGEDGLVHFWAESEAAIVRGLVAMLVRAYSGHSPDEIIATPPAFITQLGLTENLTMNRANGLAAMIKQMKFYALGFKALAAR